MWIRTGCASALNNSAFMPASSPCLCPNMQYIQVFKYANIYGGRLAVPTHTALSIIGGTQPYMPAVVEPAPGYFQRPPRQQHRRRDHRRRGLLPLAMAFAIASGVKPEQDLHRDHRRADRRSSAAASVAGPTGAFIVVLSGIVATHGLAGLQVATLMAGGLLILMGVLRMGAVIRYIPAPVIVGFTAGIGVIIWVGQWPAFFGIDEPTGTHFHEKLLALIRSLPDLHPATTILASLGLLILIVAPKIQPLQRIPLR